MKEFVQWVIFFSLIILGLFIIYYTGLLDIINKADFTKLSFVILILFLYQSLRIGYLSFKDFEFRFDSDILDSAIFFCDIFVKLGFIGTISGFIYALYHTFSNINVGDIASTQIALVCMAKGMGTALYTTAAGLVCSLLLKIQIYIYDKKI